MNMERKYWEIELTRVIDQARQANLPEVVLAIQTAIGEINQLKRQAYDLHQIKQLLKNEKINEPHPSNH